MYLPKKFEGDWETVVKEYPLGSLLTVVEGKILTSFLPFHLEGKNLFAHFALPNHHWKELEGRSSKILFQGPQSYISPTWYSECDVPTWNYVAVEMEVSANLLPISETTSLLRKMSKLYEGGDGWQFQIPSDLPDLSKAIVGVRFSVQEVQGKWKLSQNRSREDRKSVIQGLRARNKKMDPLLADWMEKID